MEPAELAAREAIRDTIAAYAHFADSGRFADLASLFAPDGVLEIGGGPRLEGRGAIVGFLGGVKSDLAAGSGPVVSPRGGGAPGILIRHHVSSLTIEMKGADEAEAASYFLVLTAAGPDHWGRYRDRFRRIEGRWLFAHRRVTVDARRA